MIEINKTHPKFNKLKVVLLALNKDIKSRYALSLIEVTPKTIAATNGVILHILDWESGWESGLYRVIKNDKNSIVLDITPDAGKFPKWEDFLPQHTSFFELTAEKEDFNRWSFSMKAAYVLARQGICVDTAYLQNLDSLNKFAKVFFGENDRPIIVTAEDFRAMIMIANPPEIEIKNTLKPQEATAV